MRLEAVVRYKRMAGDSCWFQDSNLVAGAHAFSGSGYAMPCRQSCNDGHVFMCGILVVLPLDKTEHLQQSCLVSTIQYVRFCFFEHRRICTTIDCTTILIIIPFTVMSIVIDISKFLGHAPSD